MHDWPCALKTSFVLPTGVMQLVVERARQEWGPNAEQALPGNRVQVSIWRGRRGSRRERPAGAFWIRWCSPNFATATIEQIAWEPRQGGSEDEVRDVINLMAGWPVASTAQPVSAGRN